MCACAILPRAQPLALRLSPLESVAKLPRHHGGHGGQEVQTCPKQDFSSASPVSSVVESLILQCALCSFRFVSIVSFVLDQRVQSSPLQRETGSCDLDLQGRIDSE